MELGCTMLLSYVVILNAWNFVQMRVLVSETTAVNVSVVQGDLAILPCPVRNVGDFRVLWLNPNDYAVTMNTLRVISDARFSIDQTHAQSWDLFIKDVKGSDVGLWKCIVKADPPVIREVHLHVHVPPPIPKFHNESPLTVTVQVGEEAILPCSITDLGNYKVRWLHDEEELAMDDEYVFENSRLSMKTLYNLRILHVGFIDSGTYRCHIDTIPPKVKEIEVNVKGPVLPVTFGVEHVGPIGDTSKRTPENDKYPVNNKDSKEPSHVSKEQLEYYQEQRKTAKLQRRVLQEQLHYYRHMNFILTNSKDEIIRFFKKQ